MFNPLKAGRKQLLKMVPGMIRYLEQAKRNGAMNAERADTLIAQLKAESEEAVKVTDPNQPTTPEPTTTEPEPVQEQPMPIQEQEDNTQEEEDDEGDDEE